MSDNFTEADLDRVLGITSSDAPAPASIVSETDLDRALGIERDTSGTDVQEALRSAPPGQRGTVLLDISIGAVPATEGQRAEAERMLEEAGTHPWRLEWPSSQRYARRGEEEQLVELYRERLAESVVEAKAHVHRELSAAWLSTRDGVDRQLDAVANVLEAERARMKRKPNLSALAERTSTSESTGWPAAGRTVNVSEQGSARRLREWGRS